MDEAGLSTISPTACPNCGTIKSDLTLDSCPNCGATRSTDFSNTSIGGCSHGLSYSTFLLGGSSQDFYNTSYQNNSLRGYDTFNQGTDTHLYNTSSNQLPSRNSRETFYRSSVRDHNNASNQNPAGSDYRRATSLHDDANKVQDLANLLLESPSLQNLLLEASKRNLLSINSFQQKLYRLLLRFSSNLRSQAIGQGQRELSELFARNAETVSLLFCRKAESLEEGPPAREQPEQDTRRSESEIGRQANRCEEDGAGEEEGGQSDITRFQHFLLNGPPFVIFYEGLEDVVHPTSILKLVPRGLYLIIAIYVVLLIATAWFKFWSLQMGERLRKGHHPQIPPAG